MKADILEAFNQTTELRSPSAKFRKKAFKKIDLQNKSVDPRVRYMRYENMHRNNGYLKEETKKDKYNSESSIDFPSKKTLPKNRNGNGKVTERAVLKAAGKSIFNADLSLHSKYELAEDLPSKDSSKKSLGLFKPKKASDDNF